MGRESIFPAKGLKAVAATVNNGTDMGGVLMADNLFSVSQVARLLGAKPKDISDLFYSRELRDDIAPIVAGRRLIPEGYIDTIQTVLRRHDRQVAQRSTSEGN